MSSNLIPRSKEEGVDLGLPLQASRTRFFGILHMSESATKSKVQNLLYKAIVDRKLRFGGIVGKKNVVTQ